MGDRELLERIDRHMDRQIGVMQAMVDTLQRVATGLRENRTDLRELREESRAQTQALLRLLDRMDRMDPGGAAA